jgi:hypothetical protein
VWYNVVCVYARASGKVADRREKYADRALVLLQEAARKRYQNAEHARKDPDLDPLRDRDDFKRWLAELERNAPKTPPRPPQPPPAK